MQAATLWWILAGVLTVLEMLSGTFYFLMFAAGCAAAAVGAHLELPASAQWTIGALVASAATAILSVMRMKKKHLKPPLYADSDIHSDIGNIVYVTHWEGSGSMFFTRVQHRGVPWETRLHPRAAPMDASHYRISAIDGNTLVLEPIDQAHVAI